MKRKLTPWLLLFPFLLLISVLLIGIFNGLLQSIGIIPAFEMTEPTLQYYIGIFSDKKLLTSIGISFWIAFVSAVAAAVAGTLLAYAIVSLKKEKSFWVNIIKLPVLLPHMAVAVFVINIFSRTGLLSRLLFQIGLTASPESFPMLVYDETGIGIIIAYLWKEIPFVCYYVLAVMANISEHMGETAVNLGATPAKSFFFVTLPLCRPAIANAFLIIFAFAFGAYELPFLLGATAPKALPVEAYIAYTNPDLRYRPVAMALNSVMALLGILLCLLCFRAVRNVDGNNRKERKLL